MLFIIGGHIEEGGGEGLPLVTYRKWVDLWAEEQSARIDFRCLCVYTY